MSKIVSVILAIILAVLLFVLPEPYRAATYPELAQQVPNPFSGDIVVQTGFAREMLGEADQMLYDAVKTGLLSEQTEISVQRTGYEEQDAIDVLWAIRVDSPEIFWVEWKNWSMTTSSDGIRINPVYLETGTARLEKERLLNEAVTAVVQAASQSGAATEYDKALFVHDYLIGEVAYLEEGPSDIHTAYGALVEKTAVCDGYAHAFQLLLRAMEVECHYVEGYTKGSAPGVGHAWNMVCIEGRYHLVDVTWDDFELDSKTQESWGFDTMKSYCYFLLSTDEMAFTHTDTSPYPMPICERYGFFETVGLSGSRTSDFRTNIINIAVANAQKGIHYIEIEITDPAGNTYIIENQDTELGPIVDGVNAMLTEYGASFRYQFGLVRPVELANGWCIRLYFVIDTQASS